MEGWRSVLQGDPLPWLLEADTPAVRHLALRQLIDEPEDSRSVRQVRSAAMRTDPIAAILAAQDGEGFWLKPRLWYGPKYRGTVWSVTFLDQVGADPTHPSIVNACEYVLAHTAAPSGGFSWGAADSPLHCLQGNTLAALIGFGFLDDDRVQRAIDWQARATTGEGFTHWRPGATSGPGFACGVNGRSPCAWGAIKALRAFARIPSGRRTPLVARAIDRTIEFLLSRDPAIADYPAGRGPGGQGRISPNWFKLGFPSGYVADVLQNLEAMSAVGRAHDPRLSKAIEFVLSRQDETGRWHNEHAYRGQTWAPFDAKGQPSKWVTLRACTALRAALEGPAVSRSAQHE